ncbi:MAG: response regulator [Methylococcales bacterium]|nr:response regulator [Methylococcales bacterium]
MKPSDPDPISPKTPGTMSLADFLKPESMVVAQRVMESIPAMIAVFDTKLNYIYANQFYVQTVNSKHSNWKGKNLTEYLPAYLHEYILPRVKHVVHGESVSYYIDITPADNITRTILASYEPIFTHSGETEFFVMSGFDATELKAAERRLSNAQKLEAIGQLTGGVAHDFNNQLTIIMGMLSLLKYDNLAPIALERLEVIITAAGRCANLTSQMLAFGRCQSLQPSSLSTKTLLKELWLLAKVSMQDNIDCSLKFKCEFDTIYVDPSRFESAILNLVFNARDAMPLGGSLRIQTLPAEETDGIWSPIYTNNEQTAKGNGILIEVMDDGVGMTPEAAERIFEPFFTTKSIGNGTGMGMAMVYGFVKQSGGDMEVITAPSLGSKIRIFLPRAEIYDTYQKKVILKPIPPKSSMKILVIEDNLQVASVVMEMLDILGHRPQQCQSGEVALDILRGNNFFDLVFTDIMICGEINGLELREILLTEFPTIRVICTSGYPDLPSGENHSLASDIEFLKKPIDLNILRDMLDGK